MELQDFRKLFAEQELIQDLIKKLDTPGEKIHLPGLIGSSYSLSASLLAEKLKKPLIFILNDKEQAAYFYDDLINLQTNSSVLFFPGSYKRAAHYDKPEQENIILRTEVLNQLREQNQLCIVSYPEAFAANNLFG